MLYIVTVSVVETHTQVCVKRNRSAETTSGTETFKEVDTCCLNFPYY